MPPKPEGEKCAADGIDGRPRQENWPEEPGRLDILPRRARLSRYRMAAKGMSHPT
jgi:hypothetical protein